MSRPTTTIIELPPLLVSLAQTVTGIEDTEEALRTLILDAVNRAAGGQPTRVARAAPPRPAPPDDDATDEPSPTALPPDMAQARRVIFGDRLRAARDAAGLTQDALAQQLGLTRAQVSRMEMGNRGPSFDSLIAIRQLLGISLEDL